MAHGGIQAALRGSVTGRASVSGPRPEPCDCNHSTVVNTDDSLPVAFPSGSGVEFSGVVANTASKP